MAPDNKFTNEIVLVCDAEGCDSPATCIAEWSDRQSMFCDEHRHVAQQWHDGDHEYDQTGITWTKIVYHRNMRMVANQ